MKPTMKFFDWVESAGSYGVSEEILDKAICVHARLLVAVMIAKDLVDNPPQKLVNSVFVQLERQPDTRIRNNDIDSSRPVH